jgi:hypothetical protein
VFLDHGSFGFVLLGDQGAEKGGENGEGYVSVFPSSASDVFGLSVVERKLNVSDAV